MLWLKEKSYSISKRKKVQNIEPDRDLTRSGQKQILPTSQGDICQILSKPPYVTQWNIRNILVMPYASSDIMTKCKCSWLLSKDEYAYINPSFNFGGKIPLNVMFAAWKCHFWFFCVSFVLCARSISAQNGWPANIYLPHRKGGEN